MGHRCTWQVRVLCPYLGLTLSNDVRISIIKNWILEAIDLGIHAGSLSSAIRPLSACLSILRHILQCLMQMKGMREARNDEETTIVAVKLSLIVPVTEKVYNNNNTAGDRQPAGSP